MNADEKSCPRCAETIKRAALVCRYCGHEFEQVVSSATSAEAEAPDDAPMASKSEMPFGKALFAGVAIVGLIGLVSLCTSNPPQTEALADSNLAVATNAADMALENATEALANSSEVSSENLEGSQTSVADTSTSGVVPDFDTVAHCREISEVGGTGSYTIEETCRDMEADARAALAARNIPDRIYQHCKEIAEVGGAGSYSLMNTCVEMEQGAADRL